MSTIVQGYAKNIIIIISSEWTHELIFDFQKNKDFL